MHLMACMSRCFICFVCRTTTKLGSGQFGCVDKGVWHSPEGPVNVAIKTLKPESPEEEKVKFLQEAAIMGHSKTWSGHCGEPVSCCACQYEVVLYL